MNPLRRRHLRRTALALLGMAGGGAFAAPPATRAPVAIDVWKSPTCGCCREWITHLEAHGMRATVHDLGNTAARARLKVPAKLGSCHTAFVAGYAIEGHVPAADVQRLLRERPAAVGLAVPGMPIGSPGMDGPAYGNRTDPYDVLLVLADGSTRVFSRYASTTQPKPRKDVP